MIEVDIRKYVYPNGVVGIRNFKEVFFGEEFVIGRTGCGKSTILRTMNGLIPNFYGGLFEGRVRVFGSKPSPKDIFLIKQNPEEMVTSLRVVEEIAFPLIQHGCSKSEALKIAESVAEELKIGHLLDRFVFEISTGELQLVEIASAIASGKKFLVFDEPFANLSRNNALRVIKVVKDFPHVISDHRIEFSEYFSRVVNLGIEKRSFPDVESDIGDVVYDGLIKIRERELIAVVGENGAGKTRFLKRLAEDMRRERLDFGIVLQHPPYHLTGKTVKDEVGSFFKDFELDHVLNRHPQSLSGGEMKRVAIAKAFKHKILLLDEPTAGQDVNFREKLIYLLRKYRKTAVISTHDERVAEMCDRVLKL